ncbi:MULTISPECIES: hypothetical protein [unclassified Gordonia (in: high G+C Gram-positive bacteria)]|uniref:hypothetical protein n=1 Tax=unclassified Gordonia (in: high G+C Gram-positive bacteria) TaxID=2657482 RepID=UPI001F0F9881|nr:hypothetical protein [Gordonia sp. ABSL49_1]MCH5641017.1 hypothetical protein [Gordonia sp. ABSL49_1]
MGPTVTSGPPGHAPDVLTRAADAGRLESLVEAGSPLRSTLEIAGRRYLAPLHVQVLGRDGVGRDTMARALRERLSLSVIGPGENDSAADADLWLYVLAGLPRRADVGAVRRLPADRRIVVLGKADTHGDWDTAVQIAAKAADVLRTRVFTVSALLACADLDDDEFAQLRAWVADGVEMPSMAGRFLSGPPGSAARQMRVGLLRRLDQFGIDLALALIGSGSPAAADVEALNRSLQAASGIADLVEPIRGHIGVVRGWRQIELRAAVERAAAAGLDRDTAEALLAGGHITTAEVAS